MRDEFSIPTKELLAKRVGYQCSSPDCERRTIGPQLDPLKVVNMGVAAHIRAASPGGPRYDSTMSVALRSSPGNGIWLCHYCSNLIDRDASMYSVEVLEFWKSQAEDSAARALANRTRRHNLLQPQCQRAEKLMPGLLAEMRKDLHDYPSWRVFVLLRREWDGYNAIGNELVYFLEDHAELVNMVEILTDLDLVVRLKPSIIGPFRISDAFAEWLSESSATMVGS